MPSELRDDVIAKPTVSTVSQLSTTSSPRFEPWWQLPITLLTVLFVTHRETSRASCRRGEAKPSFVHCTTTWQTGTSSKSVKKLNYSLHWTTRTFTQKTNRPVIMMTIKYQRSLLLVAFLAHVTAFTTPSTHRASVTQFVKATEEAQTDKEEEPVVYYTILTEEGGPTAQGASVMDAQMQAQMANAGASAAATEYPTLNGWYPKEDYALWGLPGAIAPTGFFDPLGFARRGLPLNDAKRLRESEVSKCGRESHRCTLTNL